MITEPPSEETMEDIIIKAEPVDPLILDLEEDVNLETTTPNLDVTVCLDHERIILILKSHLERNLRLPRWD